MHRSDDHVPEIKVNEKVFSAEKYKQKVSVGSNMKESVQNEWKAF